MTFRVTAAMAAMTLLATGSAQAADLPAIKISAANKVPQCVTPGRLGAYLESRNAKLDPRFGKIAVEYMRHGEDLQIRWDYAFFQMLVETANLGFGRDVKPRQNNFAGLGATGGGEPGESFPDISTGVRAHLQHVLLYAGDTIEKPVAERTRKVQEWGVLKPWQKTMTRPVTFRDLTIRWSPGDKSYARDIDVIAEKFFADFCEKPDPKPELVAEARRGRQVQVAEAKTAKADVKAEARAEPKSGQELARDALERGRSEGAARSALGAPPQVQVSAGESVKPVPAATGATQMAAAATAAPPVKLLNPKADEPAARSEPEKAPAAPPTAKVEPANAAAGAGKAQNALLKPSEPGKCRVWTASYGGQKAIIIRAPAGAMTHFTVLEVNEGSEKKEADAYIAVYAKGGQAIAEFTNQDQALDKAFDLCPEG